jgi:hypothetical protein
MADGACARPARSAAMPRRARATNIITADGDARLDAFDVRITGQGRRQDGSTSPVNITGITRRRLLQLL